MAKKAPYQSPDEQIAQKEQEIADIRAEQEALRNPKQEFPKFVPDRSDPTRGRIVNTAEEEKAAKAGEGDLVPVSQDFTVTEELVEDVDAQAGGAHGNKKKTTTRVSTFRSQPGSSAAAPAASEQPRSAGKKGKAKAAAKKAAAAPASALGKLKGAASRLVGKK